MTALDDRPVNPCACGCGEPAGVYTRSLARRGYVRGAPRKFAPGHWVPVRLVDRSRQPRMKHDEILDEWDWLRGHIAWDAFHERVGIELDTWGKLFYRAQRAGDPRAVKHWRDEL